MIEGYLAYLKVLDEKFEKFFKQQKPYIFCQKGCAKCCKGAQFPYSKIEITYLLNGALTLEPHVQDIVSANIKKVVEDKKNSKGEIFRYDCPFLVDDVCSVYEYRGIVCRAFGLMTSDENGRIKAPFCYEQGLNYSNVMEDGGKSISVEKFQQLGIKEEPVAYNVGYKYLTDPDFEKGFKFEFGEKKPLIDWFLEEN